MRKIRVALFGFGNTGKLIAEEIERHGGEICGIAENDSELIGKSFHGVTVTDDGNAILKNADAAVVSVGSDLNAVSPLLKLCLNAGVDTVTTSEEAFFSYSAYPALTAELDALAKAHHCTLSASGFQDCFWVHSVAAFASSCGRIDRIRGVLRYNVEEYGAALARDHGVGFTLEEFKRAFPADGYTPYILYSNEMLANLLGWGVAAQTVTTVPYVYHEPLYSAALKQTVPKGNCVGLSTTVVTETEFGGIIETECIGKIYTDADKDLCRWTFTGEPTLEFEVKSPKTLKHTAAALVNRLPQIINAPAGYVPVNRLGQGEYLTFPMSLYIEK